MTANPVQRRNPARTPRVAWPLRRPVAALLAGLVACLLVLPVPVHPRGARAAAATAAPPGAAPEAAALAPGAPEPAATGAAAPPLWRPHAAWMGRLILPPAAERQARAGDWVWIEIDQAPAGQAALIGRRLRLRWQSRPELRELVERVSTDIRLSPQARAAAAAGQVLPVRLDGARAVGPLQSLAGARPVDDVHVRLDGVRLAADPDGPALELAAPPVLSTGPWMARVRLLGHAGGDLLRVRHWQGASADQPAGFHGPEELVHLPYPPADRQGRPPFSSAGLVQAAAGRAGWTLYGAPGGDGRMAVQALEPLALMQLQADQRRRGVSAGLRHLARENWGAQATRRGRMQRTALEPGVASSWRLGDSALLIHSFGGIGGRRGEPLRGFTVPGHFAFGQARVEADPFSGEPRFALLYHQIYANNPRGIVAASHDWSAYSGDLQRGWLGTRPISDVLVPMPAATLAPLALQAEVLMARYRSGDGGGLATVTPATSCVQDSSQALWIALQQQQDPGPLARALERQLQPFAKARPDWRANAAVIDAALDGAAHQGRFRSDRGVLATLLSWRTMMPRRAHDTLAAVLLQHGHPLWILRTNQLPGADPSLAPLAPTGLLGTLPLLGEGLRRLGDALATPVDGRAIGLSAALLGLYAALVLPSGLRSGLLRPGAGERGPLTGLPLRVAGLLLLPSLVEELLFRVLPLPHPLEGAGPVAVLGWSALAGGLFVAYHPLAARCWYRRADPLFRQARFLVPCALLGLICTLAYLESGSLWPPVLLHGAVVVTWLEALGGKGLLAGGTQAGTC